MRAALEAGGQRYTVSFDLVVINPSFVTGPSLSARTDGESTKLIKELLEVLSVLALLVQQHKY